MPNKLVDFYKLIGNNNGGFTVGRIIKKTENNTVLVSSKNGTIRCLINPSVNAWVGDYVQLSGGAIVGKINK